MIGHPSIVVGNDDAAQVVTMLERLWPPSQHPATTMLALPSRTAPRLLVPPRPARVAASAIRALVSDRSVGGVLRRDVVAAGMRLGTGCLLTRRNGLPIGPGGIDAYLAEIFGSPLHVAVSVGPPRANRKPVLVLLRPDGRVVGYAKVGVDDLTRSLVRNEAMALQRLASAGLASLTVPALLHAEAWNGVELLVQSVLPTARARPVGPALLIAAARQVAMIDGGRSPLAKSEAWRRSMGALDGLSTPHAEALRRHAAAAEQRFGAALVDIGAWHGDWTPWNVVAAGGAVLAWDWERFATGTPAGYDALHHYVQSAATTARRPLPELATGLLANAAAVLRPYGVDPGLADAVTAGYLVEIGSRYVADGQTAAGPRLGRIDDWLLPALAALTSRPADVTAERAE